MSEITRLIIATGNPHKTAEIRKVLESYIEQIEDLASYPEIVEIDEVGNSFEDNAELKAIGIGMVMGNSIWVLSDDSGLEVDALGGDPGIYSARYSGEDATDQSNCSKILSELERVRACGDDRSARFRCVMILARGKQKVATFQGVVEGHISDTEKGKGGFGYDSVFIPEGKIETFGQMPAGIKNSMSHRARALAAFKLWLSEGGACS